jgi:hypothetical protein
MSMGNNLNSDSIVLSKSQLFQYALFAGVIAIVGFFAYRSGDSRKQFMPGSPTCECSKCECAGRARPFTPLRPNNGQAGAVDQK